MQPRGPDGVAEWGPEAGRKASHWGKVWGHSGCGFRPSRSGAPVEEVGLQGQERREEQGHRGGSASSCHLEAPQAS